MTDLQATQAGIEVWIDAANRAMVSQVVDEALVVGTPNARASQVVDEALSVGTPNARASQVVGEVLYTESPHARCSQAILEVLCIRLERDVLPIYPQLIGLGFNVKWSPAFFNMPTQTTVTGADIDLALADEPLHDFELTYEFLRDNPLSSPGSSEFRRLFGFFLRLGGTRGRFLFPNPDDHYVTGEVLGTTDGATNVYAITRTFGVGEDSGTEAIGVMDLTQPYKVYLAGVEQDPATYQLLTDAPCEQQVKFLSTPSAGKEVRIDCGYFYYCKFPDNTNTFEKFMHRYWLLQTIKIHSCRAGA